MIELVTGDPWQKNEKGNYNQPASYSRFLLPFSCTVKRKRFLCRQKSPLHFKEVQAENFDRERLLYFTAETANVLFRRAIWAEVDADLWRDAGFCGPFRFQSVNRYSALPVSVMLAPPRFVLFEGRSENPSLHQTLRHGFLILNAFFPDADLPGERPCLDDLLEFNELFRYADRPFPEHINKFANALEDFPANYVTGRKIGETKGNDPFFCYKDRWLSLLQYPLLTKKGRCFRLVDKSRIRCEQNNDRLIRNHLACTSDNCLLYADNRAFVWTAAVVKNGGSSLATQYGSKVERPWEFGHWCKLLNVDLPAATPARTHAAVREFEKKWAEKRTYQRWTEWGTWYGYSYHSGVMLAPSEKEPPLWRYFGEMYFDQILLLFYLRITLFAFSRELTRINQGDRFNELRDQFKLLRASFAKFTNLYQFPLISNQQQGLEMYNAARKSMDIDDLFKEVQEEISSTHEFLEMKASRRLGKIANRIACIGAVFAVGSLLPDVYREKIVDVSVKLVRFAVAGQDRSALLAACIFIAFGIWSYKRQWPSRLWKFCDKTDVLK
jgi:hypothetical protein